MYTYTMPAEKWDELNPDKQAIRLLITKHQMEAEHLKKLKDYYGGKHKILEENDDLDSIKDSVDRFILLENKHIVFCGSLQELKSSGVKTEIFTGLRGQRALGY